MTIVAGNGMSVMFRDRLRLRGFTEKPRSMVNVPGLFLYLDTVATDELAVWTIPADVHRASWVLSAYRLRRYMV